MYIYLCTECKVWLTQKEVDKRKFYHKNTSYCPVCKKYNALVIVTAEEIDW